MVLIQDHGKNPYPLGMVVPDFSALPGTDGRSYALADFQDKQACVLIFTCNHCPYAQAYETRLVQLAAEFEPQGIAFLAINANDAETYPDDAFDKMQQRAQAKGFNFPYVQDASQAVARAYRVVCTPHVFVVQARRLVYRGRIDDNWRNPEAVIEQDLRAALEDLLAGRVVARPETPPMGCSIKWRWTDES